MSALLWTLTVVGAWNAINMVARLYYRAPWTIYSWHVIIGVWAAWILFS